MVGPCRPELRVSQEGTPWENRGQQTLKPSVVPAIQELYSSSCQLVHCVSGTLCWSLEYDIILKDRVITAYHFAVMHDGTLVPSFAFPGSSHMFDAPYHIGDVMTHIQVSSAVIIASQHAV